MIRYPVGMAEPATTPRMVAVTIDCNDLDTMAAFWSRLLGVEVRAIQDGYAFLTSPEGSGIALWLQHVPEPRAGKTRIHLDFSAPDLGAAVALVDELGRENAERLKAVADGKARVDMLARELSAAAPALGGRRPDPRSGPA